MHKYGIGEWFFNIFDKVANAFCFRQNANITNASPHFMTQLMLRFTVASVSLGLIN